MAGQQHTQHSWRSSALKLGKSTWFHASFDKAASEMRAAKRPLGQRAERTWVTGLKSQLLGSWQGLGEATEPDISPGIAPESAHSSTGSGVFIGVVLLRQSHCPIVWGFDLGAVHITLHAIHWSGRGARLSAVFAQGWASCCHTPPCCPRG